MALFVVEIIAVAVQAKEGVGNRRSEHGVDALAQAAQQFFRFAVGAVVGDHRQPVGLELVLELFAQLFLHRGWVGTDGHGGGQAVAVAAGLLDGIKFNALRHVGRQQFAGFLRVVGIAWQIFGVTPSVGWVNTVGGLCEVNEWKRNLY